MLKNIKKADAEIPTKKTKAEPTKVTSKTVRATAHKAVERRNENKVRGR